MQGHDKLDEEGYPQTSPPPYNGKQAPHDPNYQTGPDHLPSAINQLLITNKPINNNQTHVMRRERDMPIPAQPYALQFSSAAHMPANNTTVTVNTGSGHGKDCICCCCACPYKLCCPITIVAIIILVFLSYMFIC